MFLNRFAIVITVAMSILVALPAAGKTRKEKLKFDEITPADWSIAEDTAWGDYGAIMIFEKVTDDDEELRDDEVHRYIYRRIRILDDAGREWADVTVPHIDYEQDIKDIKGRTILKDGTIIELTEDQIHEERVVKTDDEEVDETTFSLPGVTNDCIIEYIIHIETERYKPDWLIQKDIPLAYGEFHWYFAQFKVADFLATVAEKYVTPNYLLLNPVSHVDVTQLPNVKEATELLFETRSVPAFEEEPYALPEDFSRSKLLAYYSSNVPATAYWGEKATAIMDELEEFGEDNDELEDVIDSLSQLGSDEEKIEAAYAWVRENIQYIYEVERENEAIERGEITDRRKRKIRDNEHANHVVKRGYGTRRDMAYLFCDLLRELNIEAYPAFAVDRSEDIFSEQVKRWQFDVYLAAVQSGRELLFCAPGYDFLQCGSVPWYAEGVTALVAAPTEYLVNVPFSSAESNKVACSYDITVHDDLTVKGTITEDRHGHTARGLRLAMRWEDSSAIKDIVLDRVEDDFSGAEIDSATADDFENIEEPVSITLSATWPQLEPQGNLLLLNPFEMFMDVENAFVAEEREWPIMFDYGSEVKETATIALPDGWTVKALPSDTSFENNIGKVVVSISADSSKLHVERHFTLKFPFWRSEEYENVKFLMAGRQGLSAGTVVLEQVN